jgi:hypothetical protein
MALKKPPSAEGRKKPFFYIRTEINATKGIKKPPSAEGEKKSTDAIQYIKSRRTQ